MIIMLYGPDTFRSRQKLNEVIENYKEKHKSLLNLKHCEKFEELKEEIEQTSMFREKKLIVLKNALQTAPGFKEKFLKNLKNISKSEHNILLFEEGKVSGKFPGVKTQNFDFLEGAALPKWIKSEFEKYGAKTNVQVIEKLINFVGNDSWRLANEIKKLASYRRGRNVAVDDVELLVRPKVETDIFRTIRALAFRNKKQALTLIHQHLGKGDHPLYLLTMIAWQFRQMLTRRRNNLFTPQEIKRIYRKILETDLNIKTGKLEAQLALDLLILEI